MSGRKHQRTFTRYSVPETDETQYEAGSRNRVLTNKKGIRSKREIDWIELQALERVQEELVNEIKTDQVLHVDLINEIHRRLFGELYAWAGEYRGVSISKAGFAWPPAHLIHQHMTALDERLTQLTPCKGNSVREVARRIAEVHAELLLIHPYRDGNGRVARVVALLMALQARYAAPDYGFRGKGSTERRQRYIAALQKGYLEDLDALIDFFVEALERGRRSATA